MAPSMRVYPLGHPVEISSDSAEALALVSLHWPAQAERFDEAPLRFQLEVLAQGSIAPLVFDAGADGFSVSCGDAASSCFNIVQRTGTLRATPQALMQDSGAFLDATVLTALDWTFFIGLHAACVMRGGKSVLLCGDAGAGKSTLAYACAKAGWTYVSDNSLHWARAPHDAMISGSPSIRLRDDVAELLGETTPVVPSERGLRSAGSAPPGPCVFLQRRPGPAVLREYCAQEALEYFPRFDTRPDRDYAQQRYRQLLSHGVWQLQYQHSSDAVDCLETLL
ncbi:MAG: hypothetical protein ABI811_16945 [Acidobacteriota bacterium]